MSRQIAAREIGTAHGPLWLSCGFRAFAVSAIILL
jgi:hypothetical protein